MSVLQQTPPKHVETLGRHHLQRTCYAGGATGDYEIEVPDVGLPDPAADVVSNDTVSVPLSPRGQLEHDIAQALRGRWIYRGYRIDRAELCACVTRLLEDSLDPFGADYRLLEDLVVKIIENGGIPEIKKISTLPQGGDLLLRLDRDGVIEREVQQRIASVYFEDRADARRGWTLFMERLGTQIGSDFASWAEEGLRSESTVSTPQDRVLAGQRYSQPAAMNLWTDTSFLDDIAPDELGSLLREVSSMDHGTVVEAALAVQQRDLDRVLLDDPTECRKMLCATLAAVEGGLISFHDSLSVLLGYAASVQYPYGWKHRTAHRALTPDGDIDPVFLEHLGDVTQEQHCNLLEQLKRLPESEQVFYQVSEVDGDAEQWANDPIVLAIGTVLEARDLPLGLKLVRGPQGDRNLLVPSFSIFQGVLKGCLGDGAAILQPRLGKVSGEGFQDSLKTNNPIFCTHFPGIDGLLRGDGRNFGAYGASAHDFYHALRSSGLSSHGKIAFNELAQHFEDLAAWSSDRGVTSEQVGSAAWEKRTLRYNGIGVSPACVDLLEDMAHRLREAEIHLKYWRDEGHNPTAELWGPRELMQALELKCPLHHGNGYDYTYYFARKIVTAYLRDNAARIQREWGVDTGVLLSIITPPGE